MLRKTCSFILLIALSLTVAPFALAAEHPISTPPFGPTPRGIGNAGLVALGDGFLAVWAEGDFGSVEVRGMQLDRNGQPREAKSFLIAPSASSFAKVVADGRYAYVLWVTNLFEYRLTRVSDGGGTDLLAINMPLPSVGALAMAESGGNLLFFTAEPGLSLTVTVYDVSGHLLRANMPLADSGGSTRGLDATGIGGGAFLLSWVPDDGRVRVTRLVAADVTANTVVFIPFNRAAQGNALNLRLTSSETRSMVFWTEVISESPTELRARGLTSSGTALGDAPITLGFYNPISNVAAVARPDGGQQLLFLERGISGALEIVSLRVSAEGAVLSTNRKGAGTGNAAPVAVAQTATTTLGMWEENRFARRSPSTGIQVVAAPISGGGGIGTATTLSLGLPLQHVRALIPLASGVAGVWTDAAPNERIVVGRFSQAGVSVDGAGLRVRDSINDQRNSAAASNSEQIFVVWTEGEANKPQTLYGALIPLSGFLAANVRVLATDAGDAEVAVTARGRNFTIVYQIDATKRLAALPIDEFFNILTPAAVVLTPAPQPGFSDTSPRLAWNGSEYLLLWQRRTLVGNPLPILAPPLTVNQLYAQRFSTSLNASGAEIPLATSGLDSFGPITTADSPQMIFSEGVWVAAWLELGLWHSDSRQAKFSIIDAGGGWNAPKAITGLPVEPLLGVAASGWVAVGDTGPNVLSLARIVRDGTVRPAAVLSTTVPIPEAFAVTPLQLVAYRKSAAEPLVYLDLLTQHHRLGR